MKNTEQMFTIDTPALKLAFLHMRKSGGTHINKIVTEFMFEHGCISKDEKVSVRGIRSGVPLDMLVKKNYTANYTRCPEVNMVHEEMLALDGKSFIDNFPRRGQRKDKSFTLLTTLRHPIERIGSQAFYGKNSIARTVIMDVIEQSSNINCTDYQAGFKNRKNAFNPVSEKEYCAKKSIANSSLKNKICNCLDNAVIKSQEIIRTNGTVWFYWIQNVLGYHDQYLPNYFIRRLVSRTKNMKYDHNPKSTFYKASRCISDDNCKSEYQYQLLSDSFPINTGTGFNDKKCAVESDYDIKVALNMSKFLLRNQLDFVIMEYFDQERTVAAIRHALHGSLSPPKSFVGNTDNKGVFSSYGPNSTNYYKDQSKFRRLSEDYSSSRRKLITSSYRSSMPETVLSYLEKDNLEDIELYNFAVEEFESRSKREGWQ
jgi:hypothetical protein